MAMEVQLAGKVVAITGGARGIGRALATAFAAEGATVAIGDIDKKLCEDTAAEIGRGAIGLPLDVIDHASLEAFLDTIAATHGAVDIMVNNAGIMPITALADESLDSIQRQLDINLRGVIWGSQLAIQRMRPREGGVIVNVASAAGKIGIPGLATYCATKHAVVGLSETLNIELAKDNIAIVCVMPGVVNTELISGVNDHWLLKTVQPEDIAAAVIKAIRLGEFPVFTPRRLGPLLRTIALLPRSAYRPVAGWLGMDHYMLDAKGSHARAAYEDRASHSGPSAG